MSSSSRSSDRSVLQFRPEVRSKSIQPPSARIIGVGEMADLIRAFDWERTSLHGIETWSDTLVTTVNLILASRHPMFLWWGPDLIQFYNDGYRPSIRADKHPSALGQRGVECWPEIWPIIGPQIEAVMQQGDSTWNTNQLVPINRDGKLEEVFWTYGYSPVRDQTGAVQGTLVVCTETTEHVQSERRLRALLAVTLDSGPHDQPRDSSPLQAVAQALVRKLNVDPADLPFAALYFRTRSEALFIGSSTAIGVLENPANWPLKEVMHARAPRLVDNLQSRFGDLVFQPWPEALQSAYVLPLRLPGSSVQAILVFGLSPRLPFDHSYETFLQLVGSRVADLLQSEVQKLEIAAAGKRFRRLAEANPFGAVIGELNGRVSYMNPAFLATLGYSVDDVTSGKLRWDELSPPEYAAADARAVEQLRTTGRCDVYEKVYLAKDGRRVPILIGASAIDAAGSDPEIAAFMIDLTPLKTAQEELRSANERLEKKIAERTAALEAEIGDRRRAETSLRELTGHLLLAQDEERRHMARELHDHAGQTLVALGLNFAALLDAAKNQDSKMINLIVQSQQLSDDLSKEIRTLSYLLHPPLLDEAGLASAIRWYVEGFSKRSGIEVDLDLPEHSSRLPRALELVVFRVVQESLTNVHRHSGSPSASIRLDTSPRSIQVEITDRGQGMSSERQQQLAAAKTGVGVRGMKERVRQFGGHLQIDSSPAGTKVSVVIPLASE